MAKKLDDILTHCETMAAFEENLSSGVITQDRLVLIKETKQLWSHGQFYDCSGGGISGLTPVVYHEPSETSLELVPGVLHKWGAESPLTSLSFTLPDDAEDSVNNYKLVFTIGSGFTISLPSYLKWENDTIPTFEEGMRCEMNIEDCRIVCAIFPLPNIETASLEYVENDGVDFVRTDILVPEDCDGFRCKVALLNDDDPTEYVFGTTSSDGDFLGAYVNTMDYTLHTVYNTIDEEHADVSLGVAYEVMTTDHGGTYPSEDPLYVFTYNAGAVPATVSKLRFYYLRMYDAMGETIVSLVPARSSSGVIGLKDEVSGTFYPSENGNLIGG